MAHVRARVLVLGGLAFAATIAIALTPGIRFAYRSPDLHIALVTAEALIGLLAAYLALVRFLRRERLDDLVLCVALALLGLSNLLFAAVPAVVASDTTVFSTWASLFSRFFGHLAFAAAAFTAAVRVRRLSPQRRAAIAGGVLLVLAGTAAVVAALEGSLPEAVPDGVSPERSGRVRLDGHWAVLAMQLAGFVVYAAAAAGFTRRAARTGESLLGWLALAAVLAAAARLNYFLYPSVFTEWVYTGDFFRLLFYLVILAAALLEIDAYSRGVGMAATLDERRRIARDIHDGLAQELASIQRNLRWLGDDDRVVTRARASAERALRDARRAIAALSDSGEQRFDVALAEAARAVAEREGTQIVLQLETDVQLRPAEREALILISSEAITNAARHGGADLVRVELSGGRRPRLRITDSGRGFDPQRVEADGERGFGLVSMRDRAEGVGAHLRVTSAPGEGTAVEVVM